MKDWLKKKGHGQRILSTKKVKGQKTVLFSWKSNFE